MENRESVALDRSQMLITPWLRQEWTNYFDSSAPNGRKFLDFQFNRRAKRDSKNSGIRLSNQIKWRYVIYDYFY
jgi:hypothetical protein